MQTELDMADIDLGLSLTLSLKSYNTRTDSPPPPLPPPTPRTSLLSPSFFSPPVARPLLGREKDGRTRIKRSRTEPNLGGMIEGSRSRPVVVVRMEEEEETCRLSSSSSSVVSGKRSGGDQRAENISDEEDGGGGGMLCGDGGERKKLRLTKQQSAVLDQTFREHTTLNTKQKVALADQLGLRPRQVEVWFQNRRARTKLKQTEVDCEYLKKSCEKLTEENRRLHKEVQELRALKLSPALYNTGMNPPTTLTLCSSCERTAATSASSSPSLATDQLAKSQAASVFCQPAMPMRQQLASAVVHNNTMLTM